jgi:hypothetical protein
MEKDSGRTLKKLKEPLNKGNKVSLCSNEELTEKARIQPIQKNNKYFQNTKPAYREDEIPAAAREKVPQKQQQIEPKKQVKPSNLKNSRSVVDEPEDMLNSNDPKIVDERRAKIKQLMLARMQNNPNAVGMLKDTDLKYLFSLIDNEYFDSYLQDYIEDEKINLVVRFGKSEKTGGSCEINPPCKVDVMISRPIFLNVYIGGEDPVNAGISCRDGITCLMITLEHEMVHLILNLFFGDEIEQEGPHGPLFKKTVYDVFGHTKTYHELLAPLKNPKISLPSWKNILNPDDKVRIKEKSGRLIDCIVIEVNRNPSSKTFLAKYEGNNIRVPYEAIIYHYKKE